MTRQGYAAEMVNVVCAGTTADQSKVTALYRLLARRETEWAEYTDELAECLAAPHGSPSQGMLVRTLGHRAEDKRASVEMIDWLLDSIVPDRHDATVAYHRSVAYFVGHISDKRAFMRHTPRVAHSA